ncbi:MAG: UTRA domain-containing protein [Pseudomonadota bacterium]|nr:UTRA domain-containing protein [Pseudomonadota bacterium]
MFGQMTAGRWIMTAGLGGIGGRSRWRRASPVARSLSLRARGGVSQRSRAPRKQRSHPVRRSLRQPGGRAALPGKRFARTSPPLYLLRHAPLTEASYEFEACLPTPQEAAALGIRRGAPCLAMLRRTVSGAHVASVARLLYPGSRYSFAGQFQA